MPKDFAAIIHCDGCRACDAFAKSTPRAGHIQLAGCLAHPPREFVDPKAEGTDPQWVLAQTQQLYQIKARLRNVRAGPAEGLQTRQRHCLPIFECIKSPLETLQASLKRRQRGLTGETSTCALTQWAKLCMLLRDGLVQTGNNLVTNTILPGAIGKKIWLFMGDAKSGQRSTTFNTVIGNCHRECIDTTACLPKPTRRCTA